MERRIYFVFGDLLACFLAGAASAWLTWSAIPADWFSLIGMFGGMAIGMLVGMLAGLVLAPFFGDLELMLPASFTGMLAGMVVGMWVTMGTLTIANALLIGILAGLACLAYTYILQARLNGEVRP